MSHNGMSLMFSTSNEYLIFDSWTVLKQLVLSACEQKFQHALQVDIRVAYIVSRRCRPYSISIQNKVKVAVAYGGRWTGADEARKGAGRLPATLRRARRVFQHGGHSPLQAGH